MTKRAAWLTDIHLETVSLQRFEEFLNEIESRNVDLLLITGDIDERNLTEALRQMSMRLRVPIYFVLGNHDYYRKTIANVQASMEMLNTMVRHAYWLPRYSVVELTPTMGLIGHGGWADGGYGDFLGSSVILQDYLLIRDLQNLTDTALLQKLQSLGQLGGDHIRMNLMLALEQYPHVVVLTHAPPFVEATWYQWTTPELNDPHLPHFSCKAIGDVLLEIVPQYPNKQVTVLCGHTHWPGTAEILPNLTVMTGGATYGQPEIQQVFELE